MSCVNEWIDKPSKIIENIFGNGCDPSSMQRKVEENFNQRLVSDGACAQIPSLNDIPLHNLKTNSLVRYRCMIQDMFDPEFYLGVYTVRNVKTGSSNVKLGMFQDLAQCGVDEEVVMDASGNTTMDRHTFYCVPIPGEHSWAKKSFASQGQTHETPTCASSSQRLKRSISENETETTASNNKRPIDDEDNEMETEASTTETTKTNNEATTDEACEGNSKKTKTTTDDKQNSTTQPDLNFPLPGEQGPACLVKVYSSEHGYKVNDMVEFVGILSNDPAMVDFPADKKEEQSAFGDAGAADMHMMDIGEQQVRSPPPSLVPRLHVVTATILQHSNPLLPRVLDKAALTNHKDLQSALQEAAETRAAVLELFQGLLFGDSLAAEYLLCHLVSTVYSRQDIVAVGKFGLNLSGCPRNSKYASIFYDTLSSILAKSYRLPLTVDNLNTCKFTPRKDYTLNRLTSGVLQLSANTHLVVDETAMQPGQLDARGVKNLTAIGNVISWQKCEYDFNFHKQDFTTNTNVLVLSEGKSLIKCDCQCPLATGDLVSEEQLEQKLNELRAQLTPEVLHRIRKYIGLMQQLPYEQLPEQLQKEIENDFVVCRKNNKKDMTVDDLHMLLTLARLVCVSHGMTSLSRDMWEKAKQMEYSRKQRFTTTAQTA